MRDRLARRLERLRRRIEREQAERGKAFVPPAGGGLPPGCSAAASTSIQTVAALDPGLGPDDG